MAHPARGIALFVLAVAAVLAPSAAAQFAPPSGGANRGAVARGAARLPASEAAETIALEGAVDADAYTVGPGDVFTVSVGGSAAVQLPVTVSADGLLVVPSVGTFRVAGRPLSAVRAEVLAGLRREYARPEVGVALAVPRLFYVHVSGAVPLPGRHLLSATGRVEDALAVATANPDAGFDPRRPQNARDLARYGAPATRRVERRPALRNVRVVGRDGAARTVDLARYFATGDTRFNPTMDDGDAVYLPQFDPDREGVFVGGAVDRPGTYDWRPGDTALDLLIVTTGAEVEGRIGSVRRTRRASSGAVEAVEVPLAEAAALDVRPRDGLYAVAAEPDAGQAAALGEGVRYPGVYPIVASQTTLAALVEMAGGLAPDALVRGAYLERRARAEPEETVDGRALDFANRLTSQGLDSTATDLADLSPLTLVGRRYYAQEARRTPRLAVDLAAALDGRDALALQDGDRLVVPRDLGTVRVFGQVERGGYLPYRDGARARAYVEAAGGPGPAATEVYVVDAATGGFTAGGDAVVRAGDAVFVGREPTSDNVSYESLALQERQIERQDARERRQARFQLIQTTISVVGTLLTAVLVLNTVADRSN